LLLLLTVRN